MNVKFPDLGSPRDEKWFAEYARAAVEEAKSNDGCFYGKSHMYDLIDLYVQGNQPVAPYKPLMGEDEDALESNLAIDWKILPIVPKFRRVALKKVGKMEYFPDVTIYDTFANDETNQFMASLKLKIMMREALKNMESPVADHPSLGIDGELPQDIDELELYKKYQYKHHYAKEIETGVGVVWNDQNIEAIGRDIDEHAFDYGVAVVKDTIDRDGRIRLRTCDPKNVIAPPTRTKDWSDARYFGEVIYLTIGELKRLDKTGILNNKEVLKNIVNRYGGRNGNAKVTLLDANFPVSKYDHYKIPVVDLEIVDDEDILIDSRTTSAGNMIMRISDRKRSYTESIPLRKIYHGYHILDTNYVIGFERLRSEKRKPFGWNNTTHSFHVYAADKKGSNVIGYMEQSLSIVDNIQVNWYKLQGVIAEARPKGVSIDISFLDDIPIGRGGERLNEAQVLDLFYKKGVLVYRKGSSVHGKNQNFRPIEEIENGVGKDAIFFFNQIKSNIDLLRDIWGMNEFTDGSTPDAKSLTTIANMAYEGTNNSLQNLIETRLAILNSTADAIMTRLQMLAKTQNFRAYQRALGSNTSEFFRLSPEVGAKELGIKVQMKLTEEKKQQLLELTKTFAANEKIEIDDWGVIDTARSLREAYAYLGLKVRKAAERQHQRAMELQNAAGESNMKAGIEVERVRHENAKVELDKELEKIREQGKEDRLTLVEKYKLESGLPKNQVQPQVNKGEGK